MAAVMAMSAGEVSRFDTLMRVERRELRVEDAMVLLGLARRQVFRLLARLREEGPGGLISRKRGRPSNRRFGDDFRDRVIAIVRERYADFGPTLASEYLAEEHGITMSHETLRKLMIEACLWTSKRAKRAQVHQMRDRRARRGELIQVDGSDHDWFEGRGPRRCGSPASRRSRRPTRSSPPTWPGITSGSAALPATRRTPTERWRRATTWTR